MKVPAVFRPYIEVFQLLDGQGQLWSPSGQFLGQLSSKAEHINSIINPEGEYGSPYSLISIHNPQGQYGGEKGEYSPFNPNCQNPPIVFYQGQPLFILSNNFNLYSNGLKVIDPYLVLTIYESLVNTSPDPTSKPTSKLIRSEPTIEQLQDKLRPLSGSAFDITHKPLSLLENPSPESSDCPAISPNPENKLIQSPTWLTQVQGLRLAWLKGVNRIRNC